MALENGSERALGLLRIVAALLFAAHGLMTLFHFPVPNPFVHGPLPPLMLAAGLIELVGGGLIAVGLLTRYAAFLCSGEMAAAYFMAHYPISFWPAINQGEPAIMFCLFFFYLIFAGPGAFSLDGLLKRGRKASI